MQKLTMERAAAVLAALMITGIADNASAAPVVWSGDYNANGDSVSGTFQGDYDNGVLTLGPSSELTIDLANPAPIPLGNSNMGDWCLLYQCTVSMHLGAASINYAPWDFMVGGTIEFDPLDPDGGTANLTAAPKVPGSIGTLFASLSPTFTVNAAQIYGPVNQALADTEAATLESALNVGNFSVDVSGEGFWDSIDLGTISAILNENNGNAEVDLSFANILLSGYFEYDRTITFNNSIFNYVANSFITTFQSAIDTKITGAMISFLTHQGIANGETENFSYDCAAEQAGARSALIDCDVDANFLLTGRLPGAAPVDAPAMLSLFGLGFAGIGALSRRRRIK